MKKILIVGQTPPPIGGQAVMIAHLVNADFPNYKIYHVRMCFSREMKDMGKMQIWKIYHLVEIIAKIYYYRILKGVNILYYPPSGPNSAVYRDMAILFPTRWLFKDTIFHFHASGLSTHYNKMGKWMNLVFKVCFFKPTASIHLSESCPKEGEFLLSKRCYIVPNGLPDIADKPNKIIYAPPLDILFIGLLEESKGEMDLIKAIELLKAEGIDIQLNIAGEFKRIEYKNIFHQYIEEHNLTNEIHYIGIIQGDEKDRAFRSASIFCFPSYFHSESFPLVLIEAMEYGLPIVASKWRGIPDMIKDRYNGLLCETKNPESIADKIRLIYNDSVLREQIAYNARKTFDEKYSLKAHLEAMENVFSTI